MKKTLYLISIFVFFSFLHYSNSPTYAYDTSGIVKQSPLDDEHIEVFNTLILEFINKKLVTVKEFDDGDALEQSLESTVLERIDILSSGTERYIVNLQLYVKRYTPNNAQYTEEHLLQTVFFDIKDNEINDFHPFPAVDITNQFKLEI